MVCYLLMLFPSSMCLLCPRKHVVKSCFLIIIWQQFGGESILQPTYIANESWSMKTCVGSDDGGGLRITKCEIDVAKKKKIRPTQIAIPSQKEF